METPLELSRAQASSNWRSKPEIPPDYQSNHIQGDRSRRRAEPYGHRAAEPRRGNFNGSQRAPPTPSPNDESTLQAIAEGRRVYVGNLVYAAKPEDVEALFSGDEYHVNRIVMSLDPFTGRNPSYCFVELETKAQADHAMEHLNGNEIMRRPVKIKPCIPRQSGTPPSGPPSTRNMPQSRWERSDAHEHWKGVNEQGRRLFVGGLPKPETQNDSNAKIAGLFEGFRVEAISKVISPRTSITGPRGHSYYAFVDLATKEEADAAIAALDGTTAFGAPIKVNKARSEGSKKVDEREKFNQERDQNEGREPGI